MSVADTGTTAYVSLVPLLARLSPLSGEADPDRERALAFLGWDVAAETVEAAAIGWLVATLPLLAAVVARAPDPLALPVAGTLLVVGAGGSLALLHVPILLASAKRRRGAGEAATLVRRATFSVRLEPTPERAAAFAAHHGDGPLAASLDAHRRRVAGTGASAWEGFAAEWRSWAPALARATTLLVAATDEGPERRDRLLDRAVAVAADGTGDRAREAAARLRGPVASLYAFGVVLPLALVGTLPLVPVAGVPLPPSALFLVYDVLLPAVLLAASAWALATRPVAFPATPVPTDHPELPSRGRRTRHAACAGLGGAVLALVVTRPVPGTAPVVLPALTLGAALVAWTVPLRAVRRSVEAAEAGVPDALAFLGERIGAGVSVERAVADAGRELDDPLASVFADADRVRRRLGCGVHGAFLGPHGVLAGLPSRTLRDAVETTTLAAAAADGERLRGAATHYDRLRDLEATVRDDLGDTAETLRNTGRFFAPFVGGLTVALATGVDGFGAGGTGAGSTPSSAGGGFGGTSAAPFVPDTLVLVVGGYVVWVAVLLPALATLLVDGGDRADICHAVGTALCCAGVGFPLAVALGSAVL